MVDMKTEIEQIEKVEEKETGGEIEEIETIKERVRSGQITIAELSDRIKIYSNRIKELSDRIKDIDQRIADYRERISWLEKEKQVMREEIRELNIMVGEIQDAIKAAVLGFVTSEISGKPVNVDPGRGYPGRGKGFRVYVKTTELGVKSGLQNVNAEFSSMAKAVYALKPSLIGKRTDFKRKLEVWAKDGLIELQFL